MAANHKLTGVITGRRVTGVERQGAVIVVHFDDGSAMTVKAGASQPTGAAAATPTGTVKGVRQRGTTLDIDYEDGTTLELETAEPTASVMLRGGDGTLQYAD
jgi:hypothetical protein